RARYEPETEEDHGSAARRADAGGVAMIADQLLSRLQGVKQTGPDRWLARCPAHDDETASLSIREMDGKVLVHDFAGCATQEVVNAVGLELSDLFPARPTHRCKPGRQLFPAADVLRAVASEA